ncbi:astacin [Ancylostoma duodenale]|uniref:Metalloendopeptidase n=1 Tax=Ancylostoma duodenale TaxID=51022 RepID=A0A0C2G560_9BILA|nr:astacin [Ancylostoma duodenale]
MQLIHFLFGESAFAADCKSGSNEDLFYKYSTQNSGGIVSLPGEQLPVLLYFRTPLSMMFTTTTSFLVLCVVFGSIAANEVGGVRHKRLAQVGQYAPRLADGTVKYRFADGVDEDFKKMAEKAMQAWSTGTCLKFKEDKTGMCFEFLKNISIANTCYDVGGITHELGHALGLGHAQNRNDRDKYITVYNDTIKKQFEDYAKDYPDQVQELNLTLEEFMEQYEKMGARENNYGVPFDYGSVMHYALDLENPPMYPVDENYRRTLGSPFVSFLDRSIINEHYKCTEKCESSGTSCKHGGFPDPNNCTECVCPGGYGGQFCNEKPSDCGNVFNKESNDRITVSIRKRDTDADYSTCTYWIEAPENSRIQVRIGAINSTESPGCANAGIEIKTNEDQTRTGYRFCSEDDANITLTSHSNIVPIIAYSWNSTVDFRAALFYKEVSGTSQE